VKFHGKIAHVLAVFREAI